MRMEKLQQFQENCGGIVRGIALGAAVMAASLGFVVDAQGQNKQSDTLNQMKQTSSDIGQKSDATSNFTPITYSLEAIKDVQSTVNDQHHKDFIAWVAKNAGRDSTGEPTNKLLNALPSGMNKEFEPLVKRTQEALDVQNFNNRVKKLVADGTVNRDDLMRFDAKKLAYDLQQKVDSRSSLLQLYDAMGRNAKTTINLSKITAKSTIKP